MGRKDPRVDEYIDKAPAFAKPILRQIREAVHDACPEVVETIKWRTPTFDYRGIMCGMAAFKEHCVLGFWKGSLIFDDAGKGANPMDQFGRLTSVSDLPPKQVLKGYVKTAMALNETGAKVPRTTKGRKTPIPTPAYFSAALKKNKKAQATFENFSPSARREYLEWITQAKSDETRQRRLDQAIEWMAQGKSRNWKYEPKKPVKSRARA